MWGENWGEIIWSAADVVAVPLGQGALLLIGILVGVIGARFARRTGHLTVALTCLLLVPMVALAVTLPYRFSNGQTADANQVNANFDALANAIDAIPAVNAVDGLNGGTVNGDVTVTGSLSVSELKISNVSIVPFGDGIELDNKNGNRITLTGSGITLTSGATVIELSASKVKVYSPVEVVVQGAAKTEVSSGALLDLRASLVTIN